MPRSTKYTFCRICEVMCGLEVDVEDGRMVAVRPDPAHVASRGYVCAKGLAHGDIEHSPDRLRHPLKRRGRSWRRVSWERALGEIGAKVARLRRDHGPDSIAMYIGNPAGFSILHTMFAQGFLDGVGSRNMFSPGSQDCNNKFAVSRHLYGYPFTQPFPDIDRCSCLILVGTNPAVSKMSFINLPYPIRKLRAIEERGGKVFLVNPRRTESAKAFGEQVFIRPDSDLFFMLAFLGELIAAGGVDHRRIEGFMSGYEEIVTLAKAWNAEKVEGVTGIEAACMRGMVSAYMEADGAAIYSSTGVNQGSHGSLSFWLQEVINAVSGNLDRYGGTLVGRGLADLAAIGKRKGFMLRDDRSRVGAFDSVVDTFPCGILADEILTPGRGQIKALFVTGGNPALTLAGGDRLKKALGDLELLVTVDIFRSETAELGHYVLPAVSSMQRPDIPLILQAFGGMQPAPYLQYSDRVVEPEAEQRDEPLIYIDLARASGISLFGSRPLQAFLNLLRVLSKFPLVGRLFSLSSERILALLLLALGKGSRRSLRRAPHGILLEPNAENDFLGKRLVTDDGLVHLAPQKLMEAASELNAHLEAATRDKGRFKLISKRERMTHNSWMHNFEPFIKGSRGTNYLYINPLDAAALGLGAGELAEVVSATASVTLPVKLSEDLMAGVVALPHGWGHGDAPGLTLASRTTGVNVNLLAADGPANLERLSGMSRLTAIPVEVRRAGPEGPRPQKGVYRRSLAS